MADLALVRIDSRMVHGQVCTSWIGSIKATKIILIDDALYNDKVMSQILAFAAPQNVPLKLMTCDLAAEEWKKDQFGNGRVFIIFQNVMNAHRAYFKGFKYPELQVGGIEGAKPGKKVVHENISIDQNEAKLLSEISKDGCKIYFQMIPSSSIVSIDNVLAKNFSEYK